MLQFNLLVNGFPTVCSYSQACIDHLLLPFLKQLTLMEKQLKRRVIVFLAAPPGCGKSTLAAFLEQLSLSSPSLTPLQAAGMDGFHYPQHYLASHSFIRDGVVLPMSKYKGAPETFDTQKLHDALFALTQNDSVSFPTYDRRLHDVVENDLILNRRIILLEGNWLLFNHPAYFSLQSFCDLSLFITAREDQLKERLILRKIKGGLSPREACAFYERSDRPNVQFCLNQSLSSTLRWKLDDQGNFTDSESE